MADPFSHKFDDRMRLNTFVVPFTLTPRSSPTDNLYVPSLGQYIDLF